MEHTTFFEHYRICTNEDGSPSEVSRTGAATNYKATDTRSNESVTLQLIPIAAVDQTNREQFEERARTAQKLDHVNIAKIFAVGVEHEHFGLVSEYLEGETADSWIVAHGPMPADAVLRVGLQVVRAIAAAAFFGLTHRAIQPSNLMIVPGQSPDGGWPFVKLLNFGLASLELHSDSSQARELAPTTAPQFASPEQLLNREIDFRSEIYSLGASICFLLTGAVPLSVSGMQARLRLGSLPELHRAPRSMRNLLAHMLRENPDNRPQDPVAFEDEMRKCLTKVERRQAIGRKLGIPLAAVIPGKPKEPREPRTPLAQIWRGVVAFTLLVLAAAAIAEFFFPDQIPFLHRTGEIGVPVGVPEASSSAPAQATNALSVVANQPLGNASPALPNSNQNPPASVQQAQTSNAQPAATSTPANVAIMSPNASAQIASAGQQSQPQPPTEGRDEQNAPAPQGNVEQSADVTRDVSSPPPSAASSTSRSKKKTAASTSSRTSASRRSRYAQVPPDEQDFASSRVYHRWPHAQRIGTTSDGRPIFRLPSGRIVIVTPRSDGEDVFMLPPRRRVFVERPDVFVPPQQPFYPPGYPDD